MTTPEYIPLPGFYDLRKCQLSKKDLAAFARVQRFLHGWEQARRRGADVPQEVREVSAQYQQLLHPYMKEDTK